MIELVSNPYTLFMVEPNCSLDAGAAAIVMWVLKNIVSMMMTIVCTIHQPSIYKFESFDEVINKPMHFYICRKLRHFLWQSALFQFYNKYYTTVVENNYHWLMFIEEINNSSIRLEFVRYLQYIKEGSIWDVESSMHVIQMSQTNKKKNYFIFFF